MKALKGIAMAMPRGRSRHRYGYHLFPRSDGRLPVINFAVGCEQFPAFSAAQCVSIGATDDESRRDSVQQPAAFPEVLRNGGCCPESRGPVRYYSLAFNGSSEAADNLDSGTRCAVDDALAAEWRLRSRSPAVSLSPMKGSPCRNNPSLMLRNSLG